MSGSDEQAIMVQKKNQLFHYKNEYETLRKTLVEFPEQQKQQAKSSLVIGYLNNSHLLCLDSIRKGLFS